MHVLRNLSLVLIAATGLTCAAKATPTPHQNTVSVTEPARELEASPMAASENPPAGDRVERPMTEARQPMAETPKHSPHAASEPQPIPVLGAAGSDALRGPVRSVTATLDVTTRIGRL